MLNYALLGLLAKEPRHGYELRSAFETFLGGTWPLNIGQVYTTLARLERDGLVESERVHQELLPDRKVYSLTPQGRQALDAWLDEPAHEVIRMKDEFFIKLLVSLLIDGKDPLALIWRQRQIYMQTLSQLHTLRADPSLAPATALLLEGAILHTEADLSWLDLCEEKLQEKYP
jgi:DNA-binding PadR family transcriptional regulator